MAGLEKVRNAAQGYQFSLGSSAGAEGFLRSERRVSSSVGTLVKDLSTADSAGSALISTFAAIERSTKFGFGFAIAGAAAVAFFEKIYTSVKEVRKATDDLFQDIAHPIGLEVKLSPDDIDARIQKLDKDIDTLRAKAGSIPFQLVQGTQGGYTPASHVPGTRADSVAFQGDAAAQASLQKEKEVNDLILQAMQRKAGLEDAYATQVLRTAGAKRVELTVDETQGQQEKLLLDYEAKRAKILEEFSKPGAARR